MTDQLSDEQYMRMMGERLTILLSAADLPQEVKEALASLVPDMTPEQIHKLMLGLENKVSSGEDAELDRLKKSIQRVQAQRDAARKASQEKARKSLEHIEDLLKQAEQQ